MTITKLFRAIELTSSSNGKKQLLKDNLTPLVEQIFHDTYDSMRNYHIKNFELPSEYGTLTIDNNYEMFHALLEDLNCGRGAGTAAREATLCVFKSFDKESQDILLRVLNRNLLIGISVSNFNKVANNPVPVFSVALANELQDAKNIDIYGGAWWVSRKLDGVRCITIYDGKEVKFFSRVGKEFLTLENLKSDVKLLLDKYVEQSGTWVLDGELCIVDANGDEHFDKIVKEVGRKDHTIQEPHYKVFDILTYEEFVGQKQSPAFAERYKFICNAFSHVSLKNISAVHQAVLTSEYHQELNKAVEEGGWEGLMIRKNVPYEGKRTNNLLKIKKMSDDEYVVEGIEQGTFTVNQGGKVVYDVVSALVITHKGNKVKVGSGLSLEQRIEWLEHPEKIIGKTITVQYFEETRNSKTGEYSLRFPVLKYVYENGRSM